MFKTLFLISGLVFVMMFSSCEEKTAVDEGLPGLWISEAKADTIFFEDDRNFYHSNESMRYDHYDYGIEGDSMWIGYSGKMMILVLASKHYFELNGDDLMIDFSGKGCFGFPNERVMYRRVSKPLLE